MVSPRGLDNNYLIWVIKSAKNATFSLWLCQVLLVKRLLFIQKTTEPAMLASFLLPNDNN